jgi:hypothetical protein
MRTIAGLSGAPISAPFVLRGSGAALYTGGPAPVVLFRCFPQQRLFCGERASIGATCYVVGVPADWQASLTLFAAGQAVGGFTDLQASASYDPSHAGRLQVSAAIDLSVGAGANLPPGVYTAEFLLTVPGYAHILLPGVVEIDAAPGQETGLPADVTQEG